MTANEIENLVKQGKILPNGLNIAEMCYFMALENIVRGPQSKTEKARRYKLIKQSFEDCQRWIKIFHDDCKIRVKLAGFSKEVETGNCERCKKMIRIFDGREQF